MATHGSRLTTLSYDDWIEHVFSHEVRSGRNPWYFDIDHDWWSPTPAEFVGNLTRLFESPEPLVEMFADSQIAQGLNYLVDTSATGDDGHLANPAVPIAERLRFIRSIEILFVRLFAERCTPHLSHLDEPGVGHFMSWVRLLEGEPDLLTLAVHGDVLGPAVGRAIGPRDERFMVLSLEIGIRFVRVPVTPWVLQEIEAWHIGDGYATGPARLWDEDGRLCAIATQTAHLRTFS